MVFLSYLSCCLSVCAVSVLSWGAVCVLWESVSRMWGGSSFLSWDEGFGLLGRGCHSEYALCFVWEAMTQVVRSRAEIFGMCFRLC